MLYISTAAQQERFAEKKNILLFFVLLFAFNVEHRNFPSWSVFIRVIRSGY